MGGWVGGWVEEEEEVDGGGWVGGWEERDVLAVSFQSSFFCSGWVERLANSEEGERLPSGWIKAAWDEEVGLGL